MKKIFQCVITLIGLTSLLAACGGGGNEQVSGIFAEAQFNTAACQPKSKMITIRNDDTSQPQRVQAVSFELGTNNDNNFKIDKVLIGGTEFKATANQVQDVIIPAGGVMTIQSTFSPKTTTSAGNPDVSFLDIFLNGPRLGIMQVRLVGQADTMAPGCGQGAVTTFNVSKITITVKAVGLPGGQFVDTATGSRITGSFKVSVNGTDATVAKTDFPGFDLEGAAIPGGSLGVTLNDDISGTFDGTNFDMQNVTLAAGGGAILVTGELTTGTSSATGNDPSVTASANGSPLGADGKMTLAFTAKIPSPSPASQLEGGVVQAVFEMTKQ